jgi:hypothetical protein
MAKHVVLVGCMVIGLAAGLAGCVAAAETVESEPDDGELVTSRAGAWDLGACEPEEVARDVCAPLDIVEERCSVPTLCDDQCGRTWIEGCRQFWCDEHPAMASCRAWGQ